MAQQERDQVPLHFFRAILSPELGRMRIAPDFVEFHGNTITEVAYLKVDDGLTWELGVERVEDQVWLVGGWKEFADYYSIKFAYILMFKYKGKSKFEVSIYDPTLMEIQYPDNAEDEDTEDEDGDEECPQMLYKMKERSLAKNSGEKITEDIQNVSDKVYAKAEALTSSKPRFIVRMLSSYISSIRCKLCIPVAYSKKHIIGKKNKGIFLVGEDGVRCFVKYTIAKHLQVRLRSKGWTDFVTINRLQAGDVCVFELIDSANMVHKVTIFRIADYEEEEREKRRESRGKSRSNQSSQKRNSAEEEAIM